jgi:redox-sensing transcriptional repressor
VAGRYWRLPGRRAWLGQCRAGCRGTKGGNVTGSANPTNELATTSADNEIPEVVIRRLPIYARTLDTLLSQGISNISSNDLADQIGVTAAQIRRDLSYFGRFGKQGKGYDIALLSAEIRRILNLNQHWEVALVGFGHLGQAIARYRGFLESNFHIAAIFDDDLGKIGWQVGADGLEVLPDERIAEVVSQRGIKIGIIAVPAHAAQKTAEMLVAGQVIALLNYAPVVLQVPDSVCVRDIDPIAMLQSMTYYLDKTYRRVHAHPNGFIDGD